MIALSPPGPWWLASADDGPVLLYSDSGVHPLDQQEDFRRHLRVPEER